MGLNKRGFYLGEYTLKVLVAVIVIVFVFIPLAVKLWGAVTGDNKVQQAEKSMELISSAIEQARENGNFDFMIYSPKDWTILDFAPGQEETPDKCKPEFNNCICICEGNMGPGLSQNIGNCNSKSVCKGFSNVLIHKPSTPQGVSDDYIPLIKVPQNVKAEKIGEWVFLYII